MEAYLKQNKQLALNVCGNINFVFIQKVYKWLHFKSHFYYCNYYWLLKCLRKSSRAVRLLAWLSLSVHRSARVCSTSLWSLRSTASFFIWVAFSSLSPSDFHCACALSSSHARLERSCEICCMSSFAFLRLVFHLSASSSVSLTCIVRLCNWAVHFLALWLQIIYHEGLMCSPFFGKA